jgi:hypothetical protein
MGQYVVIYKGGAMGETPEAQEASMNAWMAWFGSLGASVIQMGSPFGESAVVAGDASMSPTTSGLTGYSIVEAGDLAAASKLVAGCPNFAEGGSVELFEALMM